MNCHAESEAIRQHVINCPDCVVSADGEVLYCRVARSLVQAERKRKFFGERHVH